MMMMIEEMEGAPRTGISLARSIENIMSVVCRSRGEPLPNPTHALGTPEAPAPGYRPDEPRREAWLSREARERLDLDSLRKALYGA